MASAAPSIEDLRRGEQPFVLADHQGVVLDVNPAFEAAFGWSGAEIRGQPLNLILPEAFQMAHQLGFSRFQTTGLSSILAHPLRLQTICRDGSARLSEHFIVAEKAGDHWRFGATLTPLDEP